MKSQATEQGQLYVDLGDFWATHHQPTRAVEEYLAGLSVHASTLVRKKLVSAYVTLGDAAEATRWNEQILQEEPADHEAQIFRGAIAYLQGDTAGAIPQLETIVAGDPRSVFARYYLGSAYLKEGKLEHARTQFYECIKYDENFSHAYLRLAELSLRKRDAASAAQYAQKVITSSPWRLDGYLLAAGAALLERDTQRAERAL